LLSQVADPGISAVEGAADHRDGELRLGLQDGLELGGNVTLSLEGTLVLPLLVSLLGDTPAALGRAESLGAARGEERLPAAETPTQPKRLLLAHLEGEGIRSRLSASRHALAFEKHGTL